MTTDSDHSVVGHERAELRRTLDVGLAKTDGRMALLAHRNDETDKDVAELAARVAALEHSRWPLPTVATLCSLGALVVTVWQSTGR
ncbi:hypothetical protein AB0O07_24985 [Streptomyces sp. NPDC093085]|uniref:hypothetical protein n=1 Tax=Streptomyces sp. NPDC093085 TaxID=3155068 RepID=UPI003419B0EB